MINYCKEDDKKLKSQNKERLLKAIRDSGQIT